MSKTIKQLADEIGVSKQAVTKCIDNLGLRSTLTKNGNYFLVGDSQEKAIKQAFAAHRPDNHNAKQNDNQTPNELTAVIDVLQTTVTTLQGQLTVKDTQIAALQEQVSQLTASLKDTTAALSAAQALHAGTIQTQLVAEQPAECSADKTDPPERAGGFKNLFRRRKP